MPIKELPDCLHPSRRAAIYDADESVSAAAMNRTIEALIRMAPEQYQWEYKRFNKRPDKNERRPYS
ncbi:MAG: hypothetical protein R3F38_02350 [Gammaproteobacteria bacterium]